MIDRTVTATSKDLLDAEAHFEAIDLVLDLSERSMLALALEHHLHDLKIERWRWDKPEILMSWSPFRGDPNVGKNIRVHVKPEGANMLRSSFESNAWFDDRQGTDSFTRYWGHFPVGDIPVSGPKAEIAREARWIERYLHRAYEPVADSSRVHLNHALVIWSDGRTQQIAGQAVLGENAVELVSPEAPEQSSA